MTVAENGDKDAKPARGQMKPVMTRLPREMLEELEAMAEREADTVSHVVRRLTKERLDQLRQQRGERA